MATSQNEPSDDDRNDFSRGSSDDRDLLAYMGERNKVSKLFDSFIEFADSPNFDTHIKDLGYDMDIVPEMFNARKEDLEADCAIVVVGETSAGKSSLINRIIGETSVLPTDVTASTSKVCRIRYADTCSVSTKDQKGVTLETWSFQNEDDMAKTLKEKILTNSPDFFYVDVLMPLQMLQGDVIIVDTPGIGDKDQEMVAQMMLDYLQNALAIVFVLNVANAGGIQHDRVARVLDHVRNSLVKMPCFSPRDVIFVLNKWDTLLKKNERDQFFEKTKAKLHHMWEEIDDSRILPLSAASEDEKYTIMFEDFKKVLKNVIATNENKRIKIHLEFMKRHLEECEMVVLTKLRFAGQSTEQSKNDLHRDKQNLAKLETVLEEAKSDLQQTIDHFLSKATENLHCLLHKEEFKQAILYETDTKTRFEIEEVLNSRIEAAIADWQANKLERIFYETVMEKLGNRFTAIHGQLHRIKNNMQGIKTNFSVFPRITTALASSIGSSGTGLLGSLIVSRFVDNSLLAAGVAAAGLVSGLLLAGFVGLGIHSNFETIRENSFKKIIETLSLEKIAKRLRDTYEDDVKNIIETFMEGELKKEITKLKESIDNMLSNLDDYRNQVDSLQALSSEIAKFKSNLNSVAER